MLLAKAFYLQNQESPACQDERGRLELVRVTAEKHIVVTNCLAFSERTAFS